MKNEKLKNILHKKYWKKHKADGEHEFILHVS